MEDLVRDNVAAKEAELHAIYDERLRNYDERYVRYVWQCQSVLWILSR